MKIIKLYDECFNINERYLKKYFQSKFYLVYNKSSCTTMNTLNAFKYINM